MIIREWHAWAQNSNQDAYPAHFREHVAAELKNSTGFLGASLRTRREGDGMVEFVVESRWESMTALAAFAGDTMEKAVVAPGAVEALHHFDAAVRHYELVEELNN